MELFRKAGLDFQALKRSARSASFKPTVLKNATFSADFPLAHAQVASHNVLGKITGTKRPHESIMIGGHWDAYGMGDPDPTGDRIRHGAADDAIGIAGVLEIARAFKQEAETGPHGDLRGVDGRGTWLARVRILRDAPCHAARDDRGQPDHGRAANGGAGARRRAGGCGTE